MQTYSKNAVVRSGRVLALAVLLVQSAIFQEGAAKSVAAQRPQAEGRASQSQGMIASSDNETRITLALPKIENAFAKLKSEGRPVSKRSEGAVSFFRSAYPLGVQTSNSAGNKASVRYANTMEVMAGLLDESASGPIDVRRKTTQEDVEENLQIMSFAFGSANGPKDLPIRVKTINKGKEESGWEVFYMEYFYRSIRHEVGPESFPKLSSPSKHILPPSKYIFQARKTATGEKSELKVVTLDGQTQEIEISVK